MIIVTCMGRLEHLKQTLPLMVVQDEVVLVEYNDPERCGRWVEQNFGPGVHVVRHRAPLKIGRQYAFHKTRSLNLGAREALRLGAERLLFLDADTVIGPGFREWYNNASPTHFHICLRPEGYRALWSLTGVLLCQASHYLATGGYDERYRSWGIEDLDMRLRLALRADLPWQNIPRSAFSSIEHSDGLRTMNYAEKNRNRSMRKNARILVDSVRRWTGTELRDLDPKYQPLLSTPDG